MNPNCEEFEVRDEDLSYALEIYTFTNLDITLDNVMKCIKDESKEEPVYLAMGDDFLPISDLEETVMDRGVYNTIDSIIKLKKCKIK